MPESNNVLIIKKREKIKVGNGLKLWANIEYFHFFILVAFFDLVLKNLRLRKSAFHLRRSFQACLSFIVSPRTCKGAPAFSKGARGPGTCSPPSGRGLAGGLIAERRHFRSLRSPDGLKKNGPPFSKDGPSESCGHYARDVQPVCYLSFNTRRKNFAFAFPTGIASGN